MRAFACYYLVEVMAMILSSFGNTDKYQWSSSAQCQNILEELSNTRRISSSFTCNSCSDECMSALRDVRAELGCCVNFYDEFISMFKECQITLSCSSINLVPHWSISVILGPIVLAVLH